MLRLVSLGGIAVMLALCYACSRQRRAIPWRLVGTGLVMQAVLGFVFLYWDAGNAALRRAGDGVDAFLKLSQEGSYFVFNALTKQQLVGQAMPDESYGFVFAFMVLPTLIFFSSFMAVLYHLGVMQRVVRAMAWLMVRLLGTSGSESLSACGNVFVGQTEAPLLVRPFLREMTMSELHAIMVGGFATIAGGVFALYVGFGVAPGHLMVGSVMAVPAGLICSKMLWPETESSQTMGTVRHIEASPYGNVVEAAAGGASDGLKLALNVGAMLIAFLGLLAVMNAALGQISASWSVEGLLSLVFWPVAAVMGVEWQEIPLLAELIGTKLAATELVAYKTLGPMIGRVEVSPRTAMIASFALCGFANIGSVAIQVGGLGAMAPERRSDLARLGLRAMFAGAIATCLTACVAGVLAGDGRVVFQDGFDGGDRWVADAGARQVDGRLRLAAGSAVRTQPRPELGFVSAPRTFELHGLQWDSAAGSGGALELTVGSERDAVAVQLTLGRDGHLRIANRTAPERTAAVAFDAPIAVAPTAGAVDGVRFLVGAAGFRVFVSQAGVFGAAPVAHGRWVDAGGAFAADSWGDGSGAVLGLLAVGTAVAIDEVLVEGGI